MSAENALQMAPTGGNAARQEPNILRLPPWVLSKIACKPGGFTGQLRVNFYAGGVTNIVWEVSEKEK